MNVSLTHTATVNIGLDVKGAAALNAEQALEVLKARVVVLGSAVHSSDIEPTLVARIVRPLSEVEGRSISSACSQERIAQHVDEDHDKVGQLFGPKAELWGPFDPHYFFTLNGNRLSA